MSKIQYKYQTKSLALLGRALQALPVPMLALVMSSLLCLTSVQPSTAAPKHSTTGGGSLVDAPEVASVPGDQKLQLAIVLSLRNQAELNSFIAKVSDPNSPDYGQYLTPPEFAAQFGPSHSDVQAVENFATSHGLTVSSVSANRMLVHVVGTASAIETTFGVHLTYHRDSVTGRVFHAVDSRPIIPAALRSQVAGVLGLNDSLVRKNNIARTSVQRAQFSGSPDGGLPPAGIKRAYAIPAATTYGTVLNGSGINVSLYELDGYTPANITAFEKQYNLAAINVVPVLVDGATITPGSATTNPGGEVEVESDIEMVNALAPNVANLFVFIAPIDDTTALPPAGSTIAPNEQAYLDLLTAIATDTKHFAPIVSSSWASPEDNVTQDFTTDDFVNAEQAILKEMAAQGQTFFQAGGDTGAYGDPSLPTTLEVNDPGSQQYVTDVGGTTLSVTSTGAYKSETSWNDLTSNGSGGGGGISQIWSIPSWQAPPAIDINIDTQASTTMRNDPDVSLNADPDTGYSTYVSDNSVTPTFTGFLTVGGTSLATPLWAATTALADQLRAVNGLKPLGFMSPIIYSLADNAIAYQQDFHDIDDDTTNGFYTAVPGYDNSTGWGSFNGAGLLTDPAVVGAPPVTVEGTVLDSSTGLPISGAAVVLKSGEEVIGSDTAGSNGKFSFNIPANASLTLEGEQPGYYANSITVTSGAPFTIISNANISLGQSHLFAAGLQFISSPSGFLNGTDFENAIDITGNSVPLPSFLAAVYDPVAGLYVETPTPPADTFHLGTGYWVRFTNQAWQSTQGVGAPAGQPYSIPLQAGWNMIGDPFTSPAALSTATITNSSGSTMSFYSALLGAEVSALYSYDEAAGTYVALGSSGSLQPWSGYWIKASGTSSLTLAHP